MSRSGKMVIGMEKRRILIWGTGQKGEAAYNYLKDHRGYYVVGFGDNNREMCCQVKFGLPVIVPSDLCQFQALDCIVIASSYIEEIKQQLSMFTKLPIYNSVKELVYTRISIDISGFCNAKCKWCVTGRKNLSSRLISRNYMKYNDFVKLYTHLYNNGIIGKATEIMLYSWGEPLLNPDYTQIVEYLAEQEQKFSVSTNASNLQLVQRKDTYKNCCSFVFSMSGFSEESYVRIHGFCFDKIKENIMKLSSNIKEHGFKGDGSISFHVYRFNQDEIADAQKFSENLGLRFDPYYPYFNGNSMTEDFLENQMDEVILNEAKEELYLTHVDELLKRRPKDYRCFLEDIISIDWKGDLVLCCAADENLADYDWGSIFRISSFEQMNVKRKEMLQCKSCQKCRALGIDYWMGNNPSYLA